MEDVVPNHHAQARVPLGTDPVGGPAKNSAAIDMEDAIVFNAKIDKAAGIRNAEGVVVVPAVDLVVVHAIYVVDGESMQINVVNIAKVFRHQMHAATRSWSFPGIGDLEVADFPILLVLE